MTEHRLRKWFRPDSEWARWAVSIIGVVIAIALVTWLLVTIAHGAERDELLETRLAVTEAGLKANAERLKQLGVEPPATPAPTPDEEEIEDSPGRITVEQVRTIVRSELAGFNLSDEQIDEIAQLASEKVQPGERGERGRQGESPSEEMLRDLVLEAAQQVCADDACQGEPGKDGSDGEDGNDGTDGVDGQDGVDGRSAYQIWLDAGNEGTEADFLASLEGSDGRDGSPGPQGEMGLPGYPESFTFTIQSGLLGRPTTYRCTDPDGDHHYACEESGGN